MSTLSTNTIIPVTGTTVTIGESGDTITCGGTASGFGGGKVLQVLQTVLTDTDSTTSTSFVDLSGLSQAITPSASSSKVLVSCTIGLSGTSGGGGAMQFVRDSTAIGIGDADGSRIRVTMGSRDFSGNDFMDVWHCQFLDSPSTTSATTYKVQWLTRYSTMYMNRTVSDTDNSQYHRTITQITVMEIGA